VEAVTETQRLIAELRLYANVIVNDFHAGAMREAADALAVLESRLRESEAALQQLRHVWNDHMTRCTCPLPYGVTVEQIKAWRDAPSNTASADLGKP
jgi:hypothetical protein